MLRTVALPYTTGRLGKVYYACPRACASGPKASAVAHVPSRATVRAPPVRRHQGSGRCCFIRERLAGMATCTLRGLAVAGGGESSESEDDGWEIGYLDRAVQVAQEAFCFVLFFDRTWISTPLA